jgi:hypothetical protein
MATSLKTAKACLISLGDASRIFFNTLSMEFDTNVPGSNQVQHFATSESPESSLIIYWP